MEDREQQPNQTMRSNRQHIIGTTETQFGRRTWLPSLALAALAVVGFAPMLVASENVPHAPFGQWAELPRHGQLVVGLAYQESEAYHIWAKNTFHDVTVNAGGEEYGIDINQGYLTFQYGITKKWAADLAVGYTTVGWRYFSPDYSAQSTSGLMDTAFGVRYQICHEAEAQSKWVPTLTARAGAVLPGTFSQDFPFAPGNGSAAIEPELILRKHFGWTGLGAYADGLFRWNRTTHNDLYLVSVGLFQQIKGWELNAGYRHLGTVTGEDIVVYPDRSIYYPIKIRENNDAVEAGFSYTTSKRRIKYAFYTRTIVDGANSDGKFWIGGSIDVPFSLLKTED
jgi:hypothetical protein